MTLDKNRFKMFIEGIPMNNRQAIIERCISDSINSFILMETRRIQPYTGVTSGQEDYSDEAYRERVNLDKVVYDELKKMKAKYPKANIKVGRSIDFFDNPSKNKEYNKPIGDGRKKIADFQRELTAKQRAKTGVDRYSLDALGYHNGSDIDDVNYETIKKEIDKSNDCNIKDTKLGEVDNSVRGKVFSYGNKKLPANTMIFNLTTAKRCPSSKSCAINGSCYGKKGENRFTSLFLRNLRNQKMLETISLKDFLKLLELYIEYAPMKIKKIRLSEDGDFINERYVELADKLAAHIYAKYGISTVIYTARPGDYGKYKNLIVNGSNHSVKNPTRYFFARKVQWLKKNGINMNGEGIQYNDNVGYYFACPCECRLCGFCYNTKEENGEPKEPITVFEKLR